jgi:hypothetical protein
VRAEGRGDLVDNLAVQQTVLEQIRKTAHKTWHAYKSTDASTRCCLAAISCCRVLANRAVGVEDLAQQRRPPQTFATVVAIATASPHAIAGVGTVAHLHPMARMYHHGYQPGVAIVPPPSYANPEAVGCALSQLSVPGLHVGDIVPEAGISAGVAADGR